MSDSHAAFNRSDLEREKSRLVEELRIASAEASAANARVADIATRMAAVDADLADFDRFAVKYGTLKKPTPEPQQTSIVGADAIILPANASIPPLVPALKDGTVGSLVQMYRTSDASTYKTLRFSTRQYYDNLLKVILSSCGSDKIADLSAGDIQDYYDGWTDHGTKKQSMGHSLIAMLRIIANFGYKVLEDPACDRLSVTLHRMKFTSGKSNNEELTSLQANQIIDMAHKIELPSMALAQAFQFDCGLRQKDVIGEWVPENEPGDSYVFDLDTKWLRGLRWEEIDGNILRHILSVEGALFELPLSKAPLVTQELARLGELPKRGPIIVSEKNGLPWRAVEYRRIWRKIADDCGIPKTVKNRHSRYATNLDSDDNGKNDEPKLRLVK